MIACCGLSGSGKTTLAAALAAETGFEHVSSDAIRKQGLPCGSPAPYGTGIYAPAGRAAVYARVCGETDDLLAAGRGVVADATFIRRADRDALAAVAARRGCPCIFLDCQADPATIRQRLDARRNGLSDARWATFLAQHAERDPLAADEPHRGVGTGGGLDDLLEDILPVLWRWRTGPTAPPSR